MNIFRERSFRSGLILSYFTVAYNLIEGLVAVIAGLLTGSSALIGFGSDSFVESLSGSVMIWRLRQHGKVTEEEEERVEQEAAVMVGWTFFVLAAYVAYESVGGLVRQEAPEPSLLGIVVAVLSIIIMPTLAYLKYQTGKAIKVGSLMADSRQTLVCVLMSVALLIGLALNYFLGIWWADAIAGFFFVGLLCWEGYRAIRYKDLC